MISTVPRPAPIIAHAEFFPPARWMIPLTTPLVRRPVKVPAPLRLSRPGGRSVEFRRVVEVGAHRRAVHGVAQFVRGIGGEILSGPCREFVVGPLRRRPAGFSKSRSSPSDRLLGLADRPHARSASRASPLLGGPLPRPPLCSRVSPCAVAGSRTGQQPATGPAGRITTVTRLSRRPDRPESSRPGFSTECCSGTDGADRSSANAAPVGRRDGATRLFNKPLHFRPSAVKPSGSCGKTGSRAVEHQNPPCPVGLDARG